MKYYIIVDVHGHDNTLMKLLEKLPFDAKLIFVGNLVDREPQSAEVIKFVREGGHLCEKGNHGAFMDSYGSTLAVFLEQK